jgi:hypothetical protein
MPMFRSRYISRTSVVAFLLGVSGFAAHAQYYYRDIVVTGQINAGFRAMDQNRVSRVILKPESADPSQPAVMLQQTVSRSPKMVVTHTRVPDATESWLKSYYSDRDQLLTTVDSTVDVVSRTTYMYDGSNRLTVIRHISVPVNDPPESEDHFWQYSEGGQPVSMLKIKNGTDSTFITFTADEKGNPGEERAVHKEVASPVIYYYFDEARRLTDVAKYNSTARRILPSYMFEYNSGNQVTQMIVVPEGSADYQAWRYTYEANGLKEKDQCFSKQKQLVASIDYSYMQ